MATTPENDYDSGNATEVGVVSGSTAFGNIMGGIQGDESWGEFVEPGGTGSQIADPLDLFGFQASADAAKAAKAQADAAMKAQQFLEQQYATLKAMQSPFIQGGQQAFGIQAALSGLQGPEAQAAAYRNFEQAQQGAVNAGAPAGWEGMPSGISGALSAYGQGVASQDYDNYFNRLGQSAGMGQAAASALGGVTVDSGRGIASAMQAGGDAATNNMLMQQQIRGQGLSNLASLGGAAIQGYGNMQNSQNISNQKLSAAQYNPTYSNSAR